MIFKKKDMTQVNCHGVEFAFDSEYAGYCKETGWWQTFLEFEPDTFTILKYYCNPTQSVVDVGAWVGPMTLFMSKLARRVYAIEPDPVAFSELLANLGANPGTMNVIPINAALAGTDTWAIFGGNGPLGNAESTLLVNNEIFIQEGGMLQEDVENRTRLYRQGQQTKVRCVCPDTLRGIYDGWVDVNFIKMDIEGGEIYLLPALRPFLLQQKPVLFISVHWLFLHKDDVQDLMQQLLLIFPVVSGKTTMSNVWRVVTDIQLAEEYLMHDFLCGWDCTNPPHKVVNL